jgi:hypothetical protein
MKTKVRMIPTLFVVGILGIGAAMVSPLLGRVMEPDDGGVVVLVDFDPPRRSGKPGPGRTLKDQVSVQLIVGYADTRPTQRVMSSPYEDLLYPPKGTKIQLHAEQFYGKSITCMLHQHGHKQMQMTKTGPAVVNCYWTVV